MDETGGRRQSAPDFKVGHEDNFGTRLYVWHFGAYAYKNDEAARCFRILSDTPTMNWLALAPIVLLLAGDAEAGSIFRMASSPIAFTRIDPIVSPGKVAGHVHEIRGSSRFRGEYTMDMGHHAAGTDVAEGTR